MYHRCSISVFIMAEVVLCSYVCNHSACCQDKRKGVLSSLEALLGFEVDDWIDMLKPDLGMGVGVETILSCWGEEESCSFSFENKILALWHQKLIRIRQVKGPISMLYLSLCNSVLYLCNRMLYLCNSMLHFSVTQCSFAL